MQIDAKKRTFLKRVRCDGVGGGQPLRPGGFVTVMARRLQILAPADSPTRAALSANSTTRYSARIVWARRHAFCSIAWRGGCRYCRLRTAARAALSANSGTRSGTRVVFGVCSAPAPNILVVDDTEGHHQAQ